MAIFTLSSLNRICTYLRVAIHLVLLHKLSKNDPGGTRTRDSTVKGWRLKPLVDGAICYKILIKDSNLGFRGYRRTSYYTNKRIKSIAVDFTELF